MAAATAAAAAAPSHALPGRSGKGIAWRDGEPGRCLFVIIIIIIIITIIIVIVIIIIIIFIIIIIVKLFFRIFYASTKDSIALLEKNTNTAAANRGDGEATQKHGEKAAWLVEIP